MFSRLLIKTILSCFILLFSLSGYSSEIHMCDDGNGGKAFQDFPCSGGDSKILLKPQVKPDSKSSQKNVNAHEKRIVKGGGSGLPRSLANAKAIFERGKLNVPACVACHGINGEGDVNMGTPRLAGKDVQFIYKQLNDFASGVRQDKRMLVMNDFAKVLSDQDRRDLAVYANSLGKKN